MESRALRGSLVLLVVAATGQACSDGAAAGPGGAHEGAVSQGAPDAASEAAGPAGGQHVDAGSPGALDGGQPSQGGGGGDASVAGGDAGAATAGCAGASVCDGFEQAAPGQAPGAPFTVSSPNCSGVGTVAVDATQAHSGARSVKVTGGGGYCDHVFFGTPLPPGADPVWARFFVRLDVPLGQGHVTFLAMHDASVDKDVRMGGQDQVLMWNRESDDATLPAMSPAGTAQSVAPSAGTWTCVELALDPAARTLQTWVDGALVAGLIDDGVPTPDVDAQWLQGAAWTPQPVDLRFGWESYAGQADTLWFDDVAVGTSRIGCGG